MESGQRYLDTKTLNKISHLELRARHIVEGFVSGMHKSPYHGFSVEFAEHRQYTPGDDLRHIDWKVFGRSDRLYLKEYELETNLRSHILLDTSESMAYSSGEYSKLELACFVAASMAYLILRQQDSVSMTCFDKEAVSTIPPSSAMAHLRPILGALARSEPKHKTDLGAVLNLLAEQMRRRGLIILISDLFDRPETIIKGLQHFRHRRHDVIVFHILDSHELDFPFQRMTRFEGLEEYPHVLVDPRSIRKAYQDEINRFCEEIRRGCTQMMVDYNLISTGRPLDVELSRYLAKRLGTKWKQK